MRLSVHLNELETRNSKLKITNGQLFAAGPRRNSVNVANVIGTGVSESARDDLHVGTPGKALTVWLVAGLLSLPARSLTLNFLMKARR